MGKTDQFSFKSSTEKKTAKTLTCFLHSLPFTGWFNAHSDFFSSLQHLSAWFRKWRLEKSLFLSHAKINSSNTYNLSCPIIFHNGITICNFGETNYANKHSQRECTKQGESNGKMERGWPFYFPLLLQCAGRQPLGWAEGQGFVSKNCTAAPGSKCLLPGERPRSSCNWLSPAPIH